MGVPSGLVEPALAAVASAAKYSSIKCTSGFSSAGLGKEEVSALTAESRAFWNSGVRDGRAVSFNPLAAALVAMVAVAEVVEGVVSIVLSTVLSSVVDARGAVLTAATGAFDNLCELKVKALVEVDAPSTRAAETMAEVNLMVNMNIIVQ